MWAPASIWTTWRTEKSVDPAGIRTRDRPVRSPVTILIEAFEHGIEYTGHNDTGYGTAERA